MRPEPELDSESVPRAGVVQPESEYSSEKLYTGLGWLDSVVGGFRPGEMALIDCSSPFLFSLLSELCVQAVTDYGTRAVFVDGGNSIRPYEIARIAKFRGQDPNAVLSRINVARAFTAHQMAALVNDNLERILDRTGASTIIVSSLLDLFLDPDMKWKESFQLVKRSMANLDAMTHDRGLVCIVSNFGAHKMDRTKFLRATMGHYPARVLSMEPTAEGMTVSLPRRGTFLRRYPVPRGQTVLERYFRGCSYGQDCGDL
jgi:hypothetical protein